MPVIQAPKLKNLSLSFIIDDCIFITLCDIFVSNHIYRNIEYCITIVTVPIMQKRKRRIEKIETQNEIDQKYLLQSTRSRANDRQKHISIGKTGEKVMFVHYK